MKVNVETKEGKKEYTIIDSWEDVTLESWAKLIADTGDGKSKAEDALGTIKNLSTMPENLIKQLTLFDVAQLMKRLADIQRRANTNLKNRITIDDVEYGFHPDLEAITLGEWADIETYIHDGLQQNLHKVMAVLYRPVLETEGNFYTIERYDIKTKDIREQKFKKMKAEDVQSACVFFWTFATELLKILPLYLTQKLRKQTEK